MLLRIELEPFNTWLMGGTVAQWHVAEGGHVRFGDPLCDISVDEIKDFRKTRAADVRVRLTSADDGTLLAIRKARGSAVRVGELLAVVTTGGSDEASDPSAVETASRFRVVADMVAEDGEQ
jgi:pyruvate/2-oxoglutarate dehydrogenase complex dihydrolipoamide acyltransferase (E2) component